MRREERTIPAAGLGSAEVQSFYDILARADQAVLMLDYDGTLAPFRVERDQATPYPGVRERIARLLRVGDSRVVLVSGRPADVVSGLLDIDAPLEIWGCHGLQRRRGDGSVDEVELPAGHAEGLARGLAVLEVIEPAPDVETKPGSIAVHLRALSESDAAALEAKIEDVWEPITADTPLELHRFDGGVELKSAAVDKGHAVQTILSGTEDDAAIAYLGDDLTDEDAFEALADRALKVLVRDEVRASRADVWLRPPGELLKFIDQWGAIRALT